jgi:hypothetical protein
LPKLVTSFPGFQRVYGGSLDLPESAAGSQLDDKRLLAHAVYGFFQNGGQRLYIKRVIGENARSARRSLPTVVHRADEDHYYILTRLVSGMEASRSSALLVSSRGFGRGSSITFFERAAGIEHRETVQVTRIERGQQGDRAYWEGSTNFQFTENAVVFIPAAFGRPPIRVNAIDPGAWGDQLRVSVIPSTQVLTRLLGIDLSTRLRQQEIPLTLDPNSAPYEEDGRTIVTLNDDQTASLREGDRLSFSTGAPDEIPQVLMIYAIDGNQVTLDGLLGLDPTGTIEVDLATPIALRIRGVQTALSRGESWTVEINAADAGTILFGPGILETTGLQEGDHLLLSSDTASTIVTIASLPSENEVAIGDDSEITGADISASLVRLRPLTLESISDSTATFAAGTVAESGLEEGDQLLFSDDQSVQLLTVTVIEGDSVTLNESPSDTTTTVELITPVGLRVAPDAETITVSVQSDASGFQEGDRVVIDTPAVEGGQIVATVDETPGSGSTSLALALVGPVDAPRDLLARTPLDLLARTRVEVGLTSDPGFEGGDRVVIDADDGPIFAVIDEAFTGGEILPLVLEQPFPIEEDLEETTLRSRNAGRNDPTVRVSGAGNLYVGATVELENAESERLYAQVEEIIDGNQIRLSSSVTPDYLEGDSLRTCEFDLTVEWVELDPTTRRDTVRQAETHKWLSLASGASNNAVTRIHQSSKLIWIEDLGADNPVLASFPTTIDVDNSTIYLSLEGGSDGAPPQARHYVGTDGGPENRTGIAALVDIDEISIIAAPGKYNQVVQNALIAQCELTKDRFAVLDAPPGADLEEVQLHRGPYDSLYAAMYCPWLEVTSNGHGLRVPPSGHVMGIYARVDQNRGVHKAPANEVLRGITGVEIKLNDREQDILNPRNINVIRDFRANNLGIRVWGARCLTSDNAWKYVPVRRLFIFLEESLDEGLQWVVFEPNGERLWARVRRTISGFLRTMWLNGALAGASEDEAFFVKCDRTTMTEDDIANGRLIILVGAAPLRPAEFVIVRVSQKTLEAAG